MRLRNVKGMLTGPPDVGTSGLHHTVVDRKDSQHHLGWPIQQHQYRKAFDHPIVPRHREKVSRHSEKRLITSIN